MDSIIGDIKIFTKLPGTGHQPGLTILLNRLSGGPLAVRGANSSVIASWGSLERRLGGGNQGSWWDGVAVPEAAATYGSLQKCFLTAVHTDQLLAVVASDGNQKSDSNSFMRRRKKKKFIY